MSEFISTPSFKLAIYARGNPNAKRVALVLPGRLDTKDYIHMTSLVDALADEGFYAISFDPPGSWESSGSYEAYLTSTYLQAIDELLELLGNRPTFLAGHSRGGSVAMLTAASHKNISGLALLMANYGDASAPMSGEIKNGIYETIRDLPPGDNKNGQKKEMKLTLNYFEESKKFSPRAALGKFLGPKLMVYGRQDEFCPAAEAEKVYGSLAEPKACLVLDTEHNYRYHADMVVAVSQAVIKFVQTYL